MRHVFRELWVRVHVPALRWLGRAGWAAAGAAVTLLVWLRVIERDEQEAGK